jgi:hypothetical protein
MANIHSALCKLRQTGTVIVLTAGLLVQASPGVAAERELSVDQFSVVKLTVKTVPDARSARSLGPQRRRHQYRHRLAQRRR